MKIAHISDLHISAKFKHEYIKSLRKLLTYITENNFDHLVITGDLTNNADHKSFETTRKILKNFGLLDPSKLTVTVGNHDIFGGVEEAEEILTFPEKCRKTNYSKKLNEFVDYFKEAFENCYFPNSKSFFPFVKELDDVILFGANTIDKYSKLKNPFASNGRIEDEELKNLNLILSLERFNDKKKIVLLHHHFNKNDQLPPATGSFLWNKIERQTMKLRGKKELISSFIKNNVELVLHGHYHHSIEYYRKNLRFLNAGASIAGNEPGMARLNIIEFIKGQLDVKITELITDPNKIMNLNHDMDYVPELVGNL